MIKNFGRQLNEAGKIKIGKKGAMIKSANGVEFRPPKKLDHFQLTTTEKDANGDYVVDVALQNKLKESGAAILNANGALVGIPIRLLYNDTELNFPHRFVSYVSGKISCHGDGETSYKRVDDYKTPHKCPCPRCEAGYQGKDLCKPTGTLTCIIDEAEMLGQAHKFRTTSENTIKGILGGIELIKTATGGRIAGLPLMLTLTAKQTTTPQGANTTVYIVSICYRGNMDALRQEVIKLLTVEKQFLLSMDAVEDIALKALSESNDIIDIGGDESDFVAEFFPDAMSQETKGNGGTQGDDQGSTKGDTQKDTHEKDLGDIPGEYQDGDNQGGALGEEQIEDNSTTDKMLAPVGPYRKVYDSLLSETNLEKAMALAGRLQKPNIIYYLHHENCPICYDATMKKPELLEVVKGFLMAAKGMADQVLGAGQGEGQDQAGQDQGQESILDCNESQTPADPGNPFDSDVIEEMLPEEDNEQRPPDQEPIDPPLDPAPEEKSVDQKPLDPAPEEKKEEKIPQEWDNSGPILKDQLRQLVALKQQLEAAGVLRPDKWILHVNYFLDNHKKPIDKAINLTKKQGSNLILMLEKNLKSIQ